MSDARSDSESNRSLRRRLEDRPTEELVAILRERNENEWRPEVFSIVELILAERSVPTEAQSGDPAHERDDQAKADSGSSSLVTLRRYFNPMEAHADRMALEGAGLRAWLIDEGAGSSYRVAIGMRLQVCAEDETAARAVLEAEPAAEWEPPDDPEEVAASGEPNGSDLSAADSAGDGQSIALATRESFRAIDPVEFTGVLLFVFAYPIAYDLWYGAAPGLATANEILLEMLRYAGPTLILLALLRARPFVLGPIPLPTSLLGWAREIGAGLLLFLVVWSVVNPLAFGILSAVGLTEVSVREDSFGPAMLASPGFARLYLLVAATYEELVFRAYLVSRLSALLGGRSVLALIAAGGMFALYHGYPARDTLVLFAGAVVTGAVYVRTRSVPRLVVAHWIYNDTILAADLARQASPS